MSIFANNLERIKKVYQLHRDDPHEHYTTVVWAHGRAYICLDYVNGKQCQMSTQGMVYALVGIEPSQQVVGAVVAIESYRGDTVLNCKMHPQREYDGENKQYEIFCSPNILLEDKDIVWLV